MRLRAFATGVGAFMLLLALYFGIVGLVSGRQYALEQFASYWYFLISLAAGFGIQMGLYAYLKRLVAHPSASKSVVAVSGTTSTAAMVSCCAHYLTNILPVLGATGLVTIAAQYQGETGVELRYCGEFHFNLESGHAMNNDHAELAQITLDAAQRQDALERVELVFAWFTGWTHELLAFAKAAQPARELAA